MAKESVAEPTAERWQVPWGLGTAVGALLICFVSVLIGSEVVAVAAGTHPPIEWEMVGYQALTVGVLISAVTLIVLTYHVGPAALGYRFPGWGVLAASAASVIVISVAAYVIQVIFNRLVPGFNVHGNVRELGNAIHGHPGLAEKIVILVWAGIEVPLTEETLFRGIIFQGLRTLFDRWIPYGAAVFLAALISGTLFGLAHFQPHTLPILIFVGVALAYVFQYGRSIYASALVHGLINALAMITLLRQV
jgi:membrane protease YdiL (CAAX protease family)